MLETRIGDATVEGRLHFSVEKRVLAGSIYDADGNAREMKNLTLKGMKISWDAGNQHYAGTVGGIAMKGTARPVAREAEGEESAGPLPGHVGGGGYAGGRFGGGGRRGRARRGESAPEITWSAYKSSVSSASPAITVTPSQR